MNGLDVVGNRFVGPRAAGYDHDFVKVPAEHFDGGAVMPARRVEASPIDGKRLVHVRFDASNVAVAQRRFVRSKS